MVWCKFIFIKSCTSRFAFVCARLCVCCDVYTTNNSSVAFATVICCSTCNRTGTPDNFRLFKSTEKRTEWTHRSVTRSIGKSTQNFFVFLQYLEHSEKMRLEKNNTSVKLMTIIARSFRDWVEDLPRWRPSFD